MQTHATYEFKAYTTENGYKRLENTLELCRELYNAALQERRDAWEMGKYRVSCIDQQNQFTQIRKEFLEWGNLDVDMGRGVLRRLDRAFASFFRRIQMGETPGHPRFKSRRRYRCIEMAAARPSMVAKSKDGRHAYVRIKGLPVLKLRTKRELPSSNDLVGLRIIKRPNGWCVYLSYKVDKEPLELSNDCIGIDMGVNKRMTLSNGEVMSRRQVDRAHKENLNRKIDRKVKGSKRRGKAIRTLARYSHRERIRNRNECHRWTAYIIQHFGFIGLEDLLIKFMTLSASGTIENPGTNVAAKMALNRSINEQTWGILISQLIYKAAWAGREIVKIDPKYTSQTCSRCGHRRTKKWWQYGLFECDLCGLAIDRDLNAAINILEWALEKFGQGPRPADEMPRKTTLLDCV